MSETNLKRGKLPDRQPSELLDPKGREVVRIEALPLAAGQTVRLAFEGQGSAWRQGVFLGTEGVLAVAGTRSPQLEIWSDSAPAEIEIDCVETDGLLRVYNIWDSGRGLGRESLSATSGMAVEDVGSGWGKYSCNDIGVDPDFAKLVFRLKVE